MRAIAKLFILALLLNLSGAVLADVEVDIPSQPVGDALNQFAEQSGLQVVMYAGDAEGVETEAVQGIYEEPTEVLDTLLASTGLEYAFINDRTVSVSAVVEDERGASDSKNASPAPILMAQNQTTVPQTVKKQESETDNDEVASEFDDERDTRGQIETIVVYGSRNAGVRRFEDDAQPYVIFDSLDIENSFAGNLESFLKTRLPMNTTQTSSLQQVVGTPANQSSIDLRGLGVDQTLILVNGRRMPSVSLGSSFGQPDINGIPLSEVERIEVLPATAAGIYGGGATGGAINIILKQNYSGVDVVAGYDGTFDGGASRWRIEANGGTQLEDGRTSISVSGSYSEADPLLVSDRDFWRKGRNLLLENNPDTIFTSFAPQIGLTTNIRSADGSELILDDGTPIGSSVTHVPSDYPGPASDSGQALIQNAGTYNLLLSRDDTGALANLLNTPTTKSATLRVSREFTNWLDVFADYSLFNSNNDRIGNGVGTTALLPGSTPTNPFQNAVRVSYSQPGVELPWEMESETSHLMVGATVRFPSSWAAQIEHGRSRSTLESSFYDPAVTIDGLLGIFLGEIDLFRDLNAYPLDLDSYLYTDPTTVIGPVETELNNTSLRLTGTLGRLFGNSPVTASALLERRNEEKPQSFRDVTDPFGTRTVQYQPRLKQDVTSVYGEVLLPISEVGEAGELELQLALRHDKYETTAQSQEEVFSLSSRDDPLPDVAFATNELSSTDYTVGISYTPNRSLQLRTSYATGFLPPSVSQLSISEFILSATFASSLLVDPQRGGVAGTNTQPVNAISGGNSRLDPEESKSWTFGLILTPYTVSGLRLSVDYVQIKKSDEIDFALTFFNILDFEDRFPDRIIRNDLTAADAALGYTAGEVTGLDISLLNVAESEVRAWDIQANYEWETETMGSFDAYVVATKQTSLRRKIVTDAEYVERVGFSDGPLEWRGNFGLDWALRNLKIGWNAQFYDSYFVYETSSDETGRELSILNQGAEKISNQIYHDLFAVYSIGDAELSIGIQNLFDKEPPILATTRNTGGYSTYGDPRLRRYSIGLRWGF